MGRCHVQCVMMCQRPRARRITYVASEKLAKVRDRSLPFPTRRFLLSSQTCSLLPSNPNRSTFVHALVTAFGLLRPTPSTTTYVVSLLRPSLASANDLISYHERSYVDVLLADPPGSDPVSCKEFGLEDVRTFPLTSHPAIMLTT